MKILMLGWEYPPKITGGLGVACQGLARGLSDLDHEVTFVLPKLFTPPKDKKITFIDASNLEIDLSNSNVESGTSPVISELKISELLVPYLPPKYFKKVKNVSSTKKKLKPNEEIQLLAHIPLTGTYNSSLMSELKKYALLVFAYAEKNNFDVVHAHDWLTFPAAHLVQKHQYIPFIAHFHSSEIDRNGSLANKEIIEIENKGLLEANQVIVVSNMLKQRLIHHYKADEKKITVIPNGKETKAIRRPKRKTQTVGFIGRFADQKAPGRFIDIARELLNRNSNLHFSMVGDGYLMESVRNKIDGMNLNSSIKLNGFVDHSEIHKLISKMDVVIIPSVAEPFGLVAIEAINCETSVVISKGAGICEFIPDLLQVDSWDVFNFGVVTDRLLRNEELRNSYVEKCKKASQTLSWNNTAKLVENLYKTQ